VPDNLTAPLHRLLAEGLPLDEIIAELKRIGFDQALTVRALCQVMALSPEAAHRRVAEHPAWR
jgi:hypothetical protein